MNMWINYLLIYLLGKALWPCGPVALWPCGPVMQDCKIEDTIFSRPLARTSHQKSSASLRLACGGLKLLSSLEKSWLHMLLVDLFTCDESEHRRDAWSRSFRTAGVAEVKQTLAVKKLVSLEWQIEVGHRLIRTFPRRKAQSTVPSRRQCRKFPCGQHFHHLAASRLKLLDLLHGLVEEWKDWCYMMLLSYHCYTLPRCKEGCSVATSKTGLASSAKFEFSESTRIYLGRKLAGPS